MQAEPGHRGDRPSVPGLDRGNSGYMIEVRWETPGVATGSGGSEVGAPCSVKRRGYAGDEGER